jgi:aryl-alcohol dehydrogenase-like predicted oxidoreductase
VQAALDAGVTLVDTADVYCLDQHDIGHNERLIAGALAGWGGPRETVIVATKGGVVRPDGRWESDARPEQLRAACERSLGALGVERLDLYTARPIRAVRNTSARWPPAPGRSADRPVERSVAQIREAQASHRSRP